MPLKTRVSDPVLGQKPDPKLCTSHEGRFLKLYQTNTLDNFSLIFCFHTFGVKRSINVQDPENQPGSGSDSLKTSRIRIRHLDPATLGLRCRILKVRYICCLFRCNQYKQSFHGQNRPIILSSHSKAYLVFIKYKMIDKKTREI